MPGFYLQFIGYEPEKRPDVLYGYPNRIASWPVATTVIPMWFAEGTAQFQTRGLGHDWWDSHRDMILRARALDDKLLTLGQMEVFGRSSYHNETVYNQGYALVRYIADIWGDEAIADLTRSMRSPLRLSLSSACRRVLGLSGQGLHNAWKRSITEDYRARTSTIRDNYVTGEVVCDRGFGNLYPTFSPDGKRIAFISNQGKDYLSQGRLFIHDVANDSIIKVSSPVRGPISWSHNGRYIAYARQKGPNRKGSHFDDLYLWDLDNKLEIRLTRDARLSAPSFSPDGKRLVAVHNSAGNQNLAMVELPDNLDEKDLSSDVTYKLLTEFDDGTQIFRPGFSPDGNRIVCSTARLAQRDIYRYDLESRRWEALVATEADERDPVYSPDGRALYWADDRTGIFNLYRLEFDSGTEAPLTNVFGGAFMPTVNDDREVTYSEFTVRGYGVRMIRQRREINPAVLEYQSKERNEKGRLTEPPQYQADATPYANPFGKMFILPRIAWDYGRFKPGLYAYTNDFLDKLSLFGGVAMNGDGDRDIYLNGEYRVLHPTMFIEVYNIVRRRHERFDDSWVIVGERMADSVAVPIYGTYNVDYRFNLTEYDIGGRLPIDDNTTATGTVRLSNYQAELKFDDGGTFDYTYFKGDAYLLRLDSDQRTVSATTDIHPVGGWRGWLEYARENNRFLDSFKVDLEKGFLREVYEPYNYHRIEAELDYYGKLYRGLVLNPRLVGGCLSRSVDPFFYLYAGGLPGLRGYSFYSLGGTNKALVRMSLRFPIIDAIDRRWGVFNLDRVYGALFAEAGDAWTGDLDLDEIKRDVGAELRIKMFSWFAFPTDIQLTGAYSLDRVVTEDITGRHEYGLGWRWYFTLLFDFL